MPIKWTPEKDQVLLLKILETSSISADVKAISENWTEGEEAPTPRAISERLVRIRAMAKNKGTGNFKVVGVKSTKSSPAKVTKPRGTPKKNGVAAGKRKRGGKQVDDPEDSEVSEISFKSEKNKTDDENDDDESNGSPTKKVKAEAMDSAMEYEMRLFSMPQEV